MFSLYEPLGGLSSSIRNGCAPLSEQVAYFILRTPKSKRLARRFPPVLAATLCAKLGAHLGCWKIGRKRSLTSPTSSGGLCPFPPGLTSHSRSGSGKTSQGDSHSLSSPRTVTRHCTACPSAACPEIGPAELDLAPLGLVPTLHLLLQSSRSRNRTVRRLALCC